MKWIDIHCHLNYLEQDPAEAVKSAIDAGVGRMITIGTEPEDHLIVLELAKKFSPHVYCTMGVHPHEAIKYSEECEQYMISNFPDERVVAVGEMGLDYYYDHSPREQQQQVFRRQLELAKEFDLPVQIHTRDAEEDTINILKEFNGEITGVVHCFTGTQWLADEALKLGLNISISGVVTFKNANSLREIVKSLPKDRIHVETDAPFLTPVPFRGKKNQPVYVASTGEYVAELLGLETEELAKITRENTFKVFKKLKE